jgi:hypothetical protein
VAIIPDRNRMPLPSPVPLQVLAIILTTPELSLW